MQIRQNYLITEIIQHTLWEEWLKDEFKWQRSLALVEGGDITESPDSHFMCILGSMSQCLWYSLLKQNQKSRRHGGVAEEPTPITQNKKEVSLPSFSFLPQATEHSFAFVLWLPTHELVGAHAQNPLKPQGNIRAFPILSKATSSSAETQLDYVHCPVARAWTGGRKVKSDIMFLL